MAKKYYVFTGSLEKLNKETMPLQQKQILRAAQDLTKGNNKAIGSDIVEHAKKKFNLVTKQKSTVLYAWYARNNEERGYIKHVE